MDVLSIAEMIKELARSNSSIKFVPRMVDDPTVRCPDITLARERLQWSPRQAMTTTVLVTGGAGAIGPAGMVGPRSIIGAGKMAAEPFSHAPGGC